MDFPEEGLVLGGQEPEVIRDFASQLINLYVPSDTGDPRFDEIAKDYGGAGTTCGFLVHWLMWRLGCRDERLVNRSEEDDELHYTPAMNISRVANAKQFVRYQPDLTPEIGDIVFLSNGPPSSEHVNVCMGVEGDTWHGADAGQRNKTGKQCARFIDRIKTSNSLNHDGVLKGIKGWISITALPLTEVASLYVP